MEDDNYGFYGEEVDEERVRDIKGITDNVSEFTYSNMIFPNICLNPDIILPKYKWVVIRKLVEQGSSDKDIAVYMSRQGELYKLGMLNGLQIKAFIDVVGLENLKGFYSKEKELIGDKIYILASSF